MGIADKARGCEEVTLRKKAIRNIEIKARGELTIVRHRRLPDGSSGDEIARRTWENTITNFGLLMQLIAGTSSAHLASGSAGIRFRATDEGTVSWDGTGGTVAINPSPDNPTNGARVRCTWEDATATQRTGLNFAELYNGDPASATEISEIDKSGDADFGTKPSNENWTYHWDIEFYSTDGDIKTALHSSWLDLIRGASSAHWTTSTIRARPYNTTLGEFGTVAAGSRTVGTNYLEFTFVSADGSNNGAWANMEIQHNSGTWTQVRDGGCKQDGSSCGTKAPGEEYTYVWRYTLT